MGSSYNELQDEILYQDKFLTLHQNKIVIRNYYFFFLKKTVQLEEVRRVQDATKICQAYCKTWGRGRDKAIWWAFGRRAVPECNTISKAVVWTAQTSQTSPLREVAQTPTLNGQEATRKGWDLFPVDALEQSVHEALSIPLGDILGKLEELERERERESAQEAKKDPEQQEDPSLPAPLVALYLPPVDGTRMEYLASMPVFKGIRVLDTATLSDAYAVRREMQNNPRPTVMLMSHDTVTANPLTRPFKRHVGLWRCMTLMQTLYTPRAYMCMPVDKEILASQLLHLEDVYIALESYIDGHYSDVVSADISETDPILRCLPLSTTFDVDEEDDGGPDGIEGSNDDIDPSNECGQRSSVDMEVSDPLSHQD
ncbi:hypothetical protein KIPB_002900 [Kipferlia bialata]|uniref:Uncharacterized protein n=1 Tax=Kipferlia bialata TaxID=797122 RepID=A0A9K3GH13_9EUKA|nr:hypothetical protein KIPB_002900 [Kipferlia bialata]|eukprot:g2900.t1